MKITKEIRKQDILLYERIGFIYQQEDVFPFSLNEEINEEYENKKMNKSTAYFSDSWLTFLQTNTVIFDLITCDYNERISITLKDYSIISTINYSTNITGNQTIGEMILDKSINGNEKVAIQSVYFDNRSSERDIDVYKNNYYENINIIDLINLDRSSIK